MTIEYTTEAERLSWERAVAYAREMMTLGATASAGRPEHVGPLVELRALALTPEWTELRAAA